MESFINAFMIQFFMAQTKVLNRKFEKKALQKAFWIHQIQKIKIPSLHLNTSVG